MLGDIVLYHAEMMSDFPDKGHYGFALESVSQRTQNMLGKLSVIFC